MIYWLYRTEKNIKQNINDMIGVLVCSLNRESKTEFEPVGSYFLSNIHIRQDWDVLPLEVVQ